jgi:predicted HAD superfamily hydrolase
MIKLFKKKCNHDFVQHKEWFHCVVDDNVVATTYQCSKCGKKKLWQVGNYLLRIELKGRDFRELQKWLEK